MRQQDPDRLWLARDGGPQELTVRDDRCDRLGLQPHVAAIWRELVHRVQVALTHEDETPACPASRCLRVAIARHMPAGGSSLLIETQLRSRDRMRHVPLPRAALCLA